MLLTVAGPSRLAVTGRPSGIRSAAALPANSLKRFIASTARRPRHAERRLVSYEASEGVALPEINDPKVAAVPGELAGQNAQRRPPRHALSSGLARIIKTP